VISSCSPLKFGDGVVTSAVLFIDVYCVRSKTYVFASGDGTAGGEAYGRSCGAGGLSAAKLRQLRHAAWPAARTSARSGCIGVCRHRENIKK